MSANRDNKEKLKRKSIVNPEEDHAIVKKKLKTEQRHKNVNSDNKEKARGSDASGGKVDSKTVKADSMSATDSKREKVKSDAKDKHIKQSSKEEVKKKKKIQDGTETTAKAKRNEKGQLLFKDFSDFRPNLTPKEVLQAGSFGGTYFRPIYSSITKQHYKDVWQELPKDWLEGLNIPRQVASSTYRAEVNTYVVKCGGSLEMWESSGWIVPQDPYGWFQWYCRFYQGRRTKDDERQISRWAKCAGVRGRWRNNLITKVVRSGCNYNNPTVSPVVRQTLQHWGYRLTEQDYMEGAKRVKPK